MIVSEVGTIPCKAFVHFRSGKANWFERQLATKNNKLNCTIRHRVLRLRELSLQAGIRTYQRRTDSSDEARRRIRSTRAGHALCRFRPRRAHIQVAELTRGGTRKQTG